MFLLIGKKELWKAAALCVCVVGLSALLWKGCIAVPSFSVAPAGARQSLVVVIDPGHGGEDGGAVAADGAVESAINLSISLRLREILTFLGQETAMTRSEDLSIYSAGAATLREKKVSDLNNRVTLINGTENAILVSIHQNFMSGAARVHGAQVFYNTAAGSDFLARVVQDSLNATVNQDQAKSCKKIPSTIFLMKNVTVPAVLVECGFLSNADEAARLQTATYQTRLATTIAAGVLKNATQPPA